MRKLLLCLTGILLLNFSGKATSYYLNANTGNDSFPGTYAQPWKTLSKSKAVAGSGDSIILNNGNYGPYIESLGAASRSNWVTYIAAAGQTAVFFDYIAVDGIDVNAYLHFEGIDILYPAQPSCPPVGNAIDITSFRGVNFITLKNCTIHGVNTYDSGGGVYFNHLLNQVSSVHDLVVDNCEIFQTGTGIRFSGRKTTIAHCDIHHIHGTMIGNLCGPMSATDLNSATNVLIENNHLHDMHFYTSEPCYNTPGWSTAHASIIGIRGRDWIVRNNHIHDTWSPGIQLYGDDCGGKYDRANLLFENNIFYDNQGLTLFYNPGTGAGNYIGGDIIFRHNTIISGRQDSAWTLSDNPVYRFKAGGQVQSISLILSSPTVNPYDGAGTIFEDNIFIVETGIGNFNYQAYNDPAAKWIMRNNLIYTKLWNCGALEPTNFIITNNITNGQVSKDYIDNQLFGAPNYSKQHGLTHAPGSSFDLSPKPESVICHMSSTGGYVGAIACAPTSQTEDAPGSYSMVVYPNPAAETVTIIFEHGDELPEKPVISIADILGNIIFTSTITSRQSILDVQRYPKGVYLLQITTEKGGVITKKIILQ